MLSDTDRDDLYEAQRRLDAIDRRHRPTWHQPSDEDIRRMWDIHPKCKYDCAHAHDSFMRPESPPKCEARQFAFLADLYPADAEHDCPQFFDKHKSQQQPAGCGCLVVVFIVAAAVVGAVLNAVMP